METTILSKLSLGTMNIKGAAILGQPASVSRLLVSTIFGKASGSKTVVDKLTEQIHTPLTGTFMGINHLDEDREYQSGLLYLPSGIHDQLQSATEKLFEEGDAIDFALAIYAVRSGNKAGYSYEASPLLKPVAIDPLEEIRKQLPGYKALAAPVEVKQAEPAKTEATKPEPAKVATKK